MPLIKCLVGPNTEEGSSGIKSRKRIQKKTRGRSHIAPVNYETPSLPPPPPPLINDGKWKNLPIELLLDIIKRVEASKTSWPARRDVVVCAAVCRLWRDTVKQVVKTPEQCGLITFPISLKQPGARGEPIQCFIRRDRTSSTFRLYLGLSPALAGEASKLLLAAKKVRKATGTEFLISLSADEFSRANNTYVGKLSSNFLGTKFVIYDQPPCDHLIQSNPKFGSKTVSCVVLPMVKSKVIMISYELNFLRTKGPRRMHCTMNTIPSSAVQEDGTAPTPSTFLDDDFSPNFHTSNKKEDPLILKNKSPRWHEQLQCWCLNFKGRVTVASVKNFQLTVDMPQSSQSSEQQEDVILQFGKIGKDIFTMDYCYPLSTFQAFAICLSSFDTKPACE
nr:tubby-like F-box protein 5 isoform X2 [Erigeron canadensis]